MKGVRALLLAAALAGISVAGAAALGDGRSSQSSSDQFFASVDENGDGKIVASEIREVRGVMHTACGIRARRVGWGRRAVGMRRTWVIRMGGGVETYDLCKHLLWSVRVWGAVHLRRRAHWAG